MKSTFENLLMPLEPKQVMALLVVARVAQEQETPFMVFGAFARDVHFYHAWGIEPGRKTSDVDISIHVKDWHAYNAFGDALQKQGFIPESAEHPEKRVHDSTGQELDLLPFGEIAANGMVTWPTDGSPWSVVGFNEAFEQADWLALQDEEGCVWHIAVASVPALVTMKLVAICDRPQLRHKKDGTDIAFILRHYLDIGNRSRLMSGSDSVMMQDADGDIDLATALMMGKDMAGLLEPANRERIQDVLRHDVSSTGRCYIVRGLMGGAFPSFARAREVVSMLLEGMIRYA